MCPLTGAALRQDPHLSSCLQNKSDNAAQRCSTLRVPPPHTCLWSLPRGPHPPRPVLNPSGALHSTPHVWHRYRGLQGPFLDGKSVSSQPLQSVCECATATMEDTSSVGDVWNGTDLPGLPSLPWQPPENVRIRNRMQRLGVQTLRRRSHTCVTKQRAVVFRSLAA
eukprot:EG_transcript_32992